MKPICEKVQTILAEAGVEALQGDHEALEHVHDCAECKEFQAALETITTTLEQGSHDVADDIINSTLVRVQADALKAKPIEARPFLKYVPWICVLGVIAIGVLSYALVPEAVLTYAEGTFGALLTLGLLALAIYFSFKVQLRMAGGFVTAALAVFFIRSNTATFFNDAGIMDDAHFPAAPSVNRSLERDKSILLEEKQSSKRELAATETGASHSGERRDKDELEVLGFDDVLVKPQPEKPSQDALAKGQAASSHVQYEDLGLIPPKNKPDSSIPTSYRATTIEIDSVSSVEGFARQGSIVDLLLTYTEKDQTVNKVFVSNVRILSYNPRRSSLGATITLELSPQDSLKVQAARQIGKISLILKGDTTPAAITPAPTSTPAKHSFISPSASQSGFQYASLMNSRSQTSGLVFQAPHGYWANTYLPGDPSLKRLEAKLDDPQFSYIKNTLKSSHLTLHDLASRFELPVDRPSNSSVGVSIHTDKNEIAGKSRMLIQIGLKALEGYQGKRQAMKVAMVLDLRETPSAEESEKIKSLVRAFERGKISGDRFSLVVAGVEGGLMVRPGELRLGTSEAALQTLFPSSPKQKKGGLTLAQSMQVALGALVDDGATQNLGNSLIWVVSNRDLGSEKDQMYHLAGRAAQSGISVSAIEVSSHAQHLAELEELALSGQGSRRILNSITNAPQIVSDELQSASRVVARALRLNIKLASHVKLVEVIGSNRLQAQQIKEVKALEESIDKQISKQLGIESDRGDDDDGIQIVIPRFLAGDYHTILLDVVSDEPGAIAEVSARYKDTVHLKNNVARASLSIGRGLPLQGPSERMVFQNYLSQELSKALAASGSALSNGNVAQARMLLGQQLTLLANFKSQAGSHSFDKDEQMIGQYLYALSCAHGSNDQVYLGYSLMLASKRKTLTQVEI